LDRVWEVLGADGHSDAPQCIAASAEVVRALGRDLIIATKLLMSLLYFC
jgi:hypothetical protein